MTSSKTNNNNADGWVQWIEDGISREYINYHDYGKFQNVKQIGFGAFSKVYQATWGSSNTVVAIKSFESSKFIMKEIVNEVLKLITVNYACRIMITILIKLLNKLLNNIFSLDKIIT